MHLTDAVVDIVGEGFDLAIRLGTLAPSSLKAKKIGVSPRIIVASPIYLARYGCPNHPNELGAHNCLIRSDLRSWSLASADGSKFETNISGNFTTNLAEAVTEAALSGLGVARKCKWEIDTYLDTGQLVTVLDDYTVMPEWNVYAVRSPSRIPSARVRAFTAFLERKYKSVPALQV